MILTSSLVFSFSQNDILPSPLPYPPVPPHRNRRPKTAQGELLDVEFLTEIMEIRESIESNASDDRVLRSLLGDNRCRVDEARSRLSEAFDVADYAEARRLTVRLRYWRRIEEEIVERVSSVSSD